jgi:hypothetical protein
MGATSSSSRTRREDKKEGFREMIWRGLPLFRIDVKLDKDFEPSHKFNISFIAVSLSWVSALAEASSN